MITDIVIALFFIAALFRGRDLGLARQLCSALGFFGGLIIGALIQPNFIHLAHTPVTRLTLTLAITLGSAVILLLVGEIVGEKIKQHLSGKIISKLDNGAGSLAGGAAALIGAWLVAAILVTVPIIGLQSSIKNSYAINSLNKILPPAPAVVAQLGYLINPNGFPQVFLGGEPIPPGGVAAPGINGQLKSAVQADAKSVVKVKGIGCGGLVEGSGFVAADNSVITNAHVVAGISQPYVIDANGHHPATSIYFDPNLDIAILKTKGLAGPPLKISTSHIDPETKGAVMGYPGGGQLQADGTAVINSFVATGRNIYNQGRTDRQVLALKADIEHGNSGGPLINDQGQVIGVVFAKSIDYRDTGYALAMNPVSKDLASARHHQQPTPTGQCAG